MCARVYVCVRARMCMYVGVCVCTRARVCVCMCVCVCDQNNPSSTPPGFDLPRMYSPGDTNHRRFRSLRLCPFLYARRRSVVTSLRSFIPSLTRCPVGAGPRDAAGDPPIPLPPMGGGLGCSHLWTRLPSAGGCCGEVVRADGVSAYRRALHVSFEF